jgi:hypothetical protein
MMNNKSRDFATAFTVYITKYFRWTRTFSRNYTTETLQPNAEVE